MLKAYQIHTWDEPTGVVFHETRPKAMWSVVRLYVELFGGTERDAFMQIKIRRRPELDRLGSKVNKGDQYDGDYVNTLMRQEDAP